MIEHEQAATEGSSPRPGVRGAVITGIVGALLLAGLVFAMGGRDLFDSPAGQPTFVPGGPYPTTSATPEAATTSAPHHHRPPARHHPSPRPAITNDQAGDQAFMVYARSVGEPFTSATDEQVIRVGHAICADLDSGQTFEQVGMSLWDYVSAEDAGTVVGAAIGSICPRHRDELR